MTSAISHLATPDFDAIRAMTSEDAAKPVVSILRTMEAADEHIESLTRQVYALRGAAMKIAEEKKIYEQFEDEEVGKPFRSLDRWNKATFPKSWRYNQEALATISKLPEVPMEQLVSMPRCNMVMLANNVSSSVRALPDVLEAAQTLSEDEFAAKLTKDHGQALERPLTLKLTYPSGDMAAVKTFLGWVAGKADLAPDDYAGSLLYLAINENSEHE
jgi:hypothetical protein